MCNIANISAQLYEHPETVTPPVRDKQHPLFACVYNQQVYFFQSPANRDAFMKDPVLYTRFRPPLKPVVPMCIVVTGPPKSGKTLSAFSLVTNKFYREFCNVNFRRLYVDRFASNFNYKFYNLRNMIITQSDT